MARKKHGELQPVIKKWEVHRRTPPFPVWKTSLMLMDEEVQKLAFFTQSITMIL